MSLFQKPFSRFSKKQESEETQNETRDNTEEAMPAAASSNITFVTYQENQQMASTEEYTVLSHDPSSLGQVAMILENIEAALSVYKSNGGCVKEACDAVIPEHIRESIPHYKLLVEFFVGLLYGSLSGYLLGKVFRKTLVFAGAGFALLQVLNYLGYIDINWKKIRNDAVKLSGVKDSTEMNVEELRLCTNRIVAILSKLPSSAGIGTGFVYGFRLS